MIMSLLFVPFYQSSMRTAQPIDAIEEDVFTCPETRERIKRNVYELRLGMLTNIYQQKLQEVDERANSVLNSIPNHLRTTRICHLR